MFAVHEVLHDLLMAAYVTRTISIMGGGGGATAPSADLRNSSSPLQRFVKGKRKINDIFVEIEDYVRDSRDYVTGE